MSFRIHRKDVSGIAVLETEGSLDLSGSPLLKDAVQEALDAGSRRLVVIIEDVHYVDSTGLGVLLQAYTWAANRGGQLVLVGATKKVRDLLLITKLYSVFRSFDTLQEALAHFGEASSSAAS